MPRLRQRRVFLDRVAQHPVHMHRLRHDFPRRKMPRVTHLPRRAKHTAHRAPDLRTDARRRSPLVTHQDRLDPVRVLQRQQILPRKPVARIRFPRDPQPPEHRLRLQSRAQTRGQFPHRRHRLRPVQIQILPQPRRMHRAHVPTGHQRRQLGARESVKIDE